MTPPTTLLRRIVLIALAIAASSAANAVNYTPKFSDYAFPSDLKAPAAAA